MFSMANFGGWLLEELERRDWSQSDLSRKSGLSRSTISNLISGNRGLGKDVALALSDAFGLPLTDVIAAAGDIPAQIESGLVRRIDHLANQMDEAEQKDLIEYIMLRLRLKKGKGKNAK